MHGAQLQHQSLVADVGAAASPAEQGALQMRRLLAEVAVAGHPIARKHLRMVGNIAWLH